MYAIRSYYAFGYPEYFAVSFAARKLGRPILWRAERSEGMATDYMGRDHVTTARAAFDADHKLLALRFEIPANLGAYNSPLGQFVITSYSIHYTKLYEMRAAV